MGNCIDVQKPVMWADDEGWEEEPESPKRCRGVKRYKGAPVEEIEGDDGVKGGSAAAVATEIKIKMSKMQLQELLRQAEEKGLPLNKLLADLVAIGGQICLHSDDGNHWRPRLQSIPEISE